MNDLSFGTLLKQFRKRAGMTQRDLAAALGYSDSLISNLENAQVKPDLQAVTSRFIPALGLQDDPGGATYLIERAAAARGERPPASFSFARTTQVKIQEEVEWQVEQLPLALTEIVGRSEEIQLLCNRLLGHSGRLLTLVGPPGIGKTRLALAVAGSLQHHFAGGALFIPLAEITDPLLVASAILAAVGSSDASSKLPKIKLIECLRRKTMLLVLDNCEQIHDAASLVTELLAACAGIVILATSRERLHLRAEQRHQVPPLELEPAVELFRQRASAVDAGFRLTDASRPTVEAICRRLDCLPLALELCAAQTDLLTPPQLLAHLQTRRLDLLVDGAHDLPMRQRTLRHAIQSSYALLSAQERTLFRSLGVFVGGFDLEAVEMVAMPSSQEGAHADRVGLHSTFHALLGKSLVRREVTPTGEQRFFLLETIREFALEQLAAHAEDAEMRRRHYLAYLQRFHAGDSHLNGPEERSWLARLEPDQDNLRAALQWALDEERYADMAVLLIVVGYFHYITGQWYLLARWFVQLLPHRHRLTAELRLATLIDFLICSRSFEEIPSPESYRTEIFELMEICPRKQLHAAAWFFLAGYLPDAAQIGAALERSVMLARASVGEQKSAAEFDFHEDPDFEIAAYQWGYGGFLLEQGEVTKGIALVNDSLNRFRRRGNVAWIGDCLGTLGQAALQAGDIEGAHTHFQEVVNIGIANKLPGTLCEWQPYLGLVTFYRGNLIEARRLLQEALPLCLEMKDTHYLSRLYTIFAELALLEDSPEQVAHWLAQSLAAEAPSARVTSDDLQRLFVTARLATVQHHYERAAMLFGAAGAAFGQIRYLYPGPMLALCAAAQSAVEEALGEERFAAAYVSGQQLSPAQAFAAIAQDDT